ncbi:hypothetical protein [Noviherbaspirillum denitrificans]|uniref:Lysozyme inhibitor LprI N-terminal domain-containing protein n=1 Tax=Noviherbaspirillum denitrificans TaxID=1968433 RepID=A0A254TPM8_9BURK|nr:hypothetical protein [Noviherbaspirillum denitrificans]OWW21688.1 hypothetical protein AYR66_21555 [Noviherbaspirillum denitrificans]
MKRIIAVALLLACVNVTTAAGTGPVDTFGPQLDCATKKALNNYNQAMSEVSRVRRAVDSCIAGSLDKEARLIRASTRTTLVELEARREDLVEATMRRLQLCRDTGIGAGKFPVACPQLFTLERIAID